MHNSRPLTLIKKDYFAVSKFTYCICFVGDLKSWEENKSNKSQPMKASSFANEDLAPFNPTFLKGFYDLDDCLILRKGC